MIFTVEKIEILNERKKKTFDIAQIEKYVDTHTIYRCKKKEWHFGKRVWRRKMDICMNMFVKVLAVIKKIKIECRYDMAASQLLLQGLSIFLISKLQLTHL